MILLFTNKEDEHPTNVIKYLMAWKVPVFRFNTECLLTDYEFEWWCGDAEMDFRLKNLKNGIEIYGHDITAIWDRRPMKPETLPIESEFEGVNEHILEEAHSFLSFLRYYLKDIFSIGSIVQDRPSDSKMLQMAVARSVGMKLPRTIFSNRKRPVCDYFKDHSELLLKPLSTSDVYMEKENMEYVFYSMKVPMPNIESQPEEAFSQTVTFAQTYIPKQYELRVTVVCDDVIACKIDSQAQSDDTGKIDWRQGYEHGLKHEIVQLPVVVSNQCRAYLSKLGLNFGCFDFIVTPQGDYYFLECNPNGQWLWIEIETGFDISKVVASNLAKYEMERQE